MIFLRSRAQRGFLQCLESGRACVNSLARATLFAITTSRWPYCLIAVRFYDSLDIAYAGQSDS